MPVIRGCSPQEGMAFFLGFFSCACRFSTPSEDCSLEDPPFPQLSLRLPPSCSCHIHSDLGDTVQSDRSRKDCLKSKGPGFS
jgi:hypothetical protein